MVNDKEKQEYNHQLQKLYDVHSEIMYIISVTKHDRVLLKLSETIYPINRAIRDLEEILSDND